MRRREKLAVISVLSLAATAQDRNTLETKVTAEGSLVLLEWSKNHPWGPELAARGATLVAEYYTSSRGVVSEVLRVAGGRAAAGPGAAGERSLRFRLPDRLAAAPEGPVCLLIQLPDRKVLPLRKANNRGDETARFRFEAWEAGAAARASLELVKARIETAERALEVKKRDVAAQEAIVAKGGWTNAGACASIAAPVAGQVARPYDAVEPSEQDGVARKVCIHRVWNGEQLLEQRRAAAQKGDAEAAKKYAGAGIRIVRSPELLDSIVALLRKLVNDPAPVLQSRFEQADAYRADWRKWSPGAPSYKRPHFGEPEDILYLQSEAGEAASRFLLPLLGKDVGLELKEEQVRATDVTGYLGGSLEAYFRCVDDGRKQLRTKYESWAALREKAPELRAMAQADLVRACQRETGLLERLKREAAALSEQLGKDREALAKLSGTPVVAAAAGGGAKQLNFAACQAAGAR